MSERSITLYCREGSSDKVYQVHLRAHADGWVVDYANGPRGKALRPGTKTDTPVSLKEAEAIYDKLVKSKMKGGYTEDQSGARYTRSELAGRVSGHAQQLPSAIDRETCDHLLNDPDWAMQEKANGERRTLLVKDGQVQGVNKLGLLVDVPESWVSEFGRLFSADIDGEQVGEDFFAFDLLRLGELDLRQESFDTRYTTLASLVDTHQPILRSLHLLTASLSSDVKRAHFQSIGSDSREGVVFKRRDAPYQAGRSGDSLKFKFLESSTCIVVARNQQRSVQIGLLSTDGSEQLVKLGNVTIPANHQVPEEGALVEVQYLYYNPGGAFEQPTYLGARTDIAREEATFAQVTRLKPGVRMDAFGALVQDAGEEDPAPARVYERNRG
ncbi:MAG TPA: hypothetical protein VN259_17235 [Xanthomonadales bacterium]|nr:hypothetical protein [Xanthomonadales bacterium]